MDRPVLNEVPIPQRPEPGTISITIGPDQWDNFTEVVYDNGGILLEIEEVNNVEVIVRAYQRKLV
jgi:hypothetical protein